MLLNHLVTSTVLSFSWGSLHFFKSVFQVVPFDFPLELTLNRSKDMLVTLWLWDSGIDIDQTRLPKLFSLTTGRICLGSELVNMSWRLKQPSGQSAVNSFWKKVNEVGQTHLKLTSLSGRSLRMSTWEQCHPGFMPVLSWPIRIFSMISPTSSNYIKKKKGTTC